MRLRLTLIAEEAGRCLAPIPIAETTAATRLLAKFELVDLIEVALNSERLVSLPPAPGAVGAQVLADGAIADVVLGLIDGELVLVSRPETIQPLSNMGCLPLGPVAGRHLRALSLRPTLPLNRQPTRPRRGQSASGRRSCGDCEPGDRDGGRICS